MPPQIAASAAASASASSATSRTSLPPHSIRTGVSVSAQVTMTRRPVRADPVKAIVSTPARHSASLVGLKPVTTWSTGASGTASAQRSASQRATPGVYSLGLKTMVLAAASPYAIEPIGVNTG
jgi:hypothetical protein